MKQIYLLILVLSFSFASVQAQVPDDCPATLGNQSTQSIIHFKIPSGTCGTFPNSIMVSNPDGSENITYNLLSCNGTNLKYQVDGGVVVGSAADIDVDFGGGLICHYRNGQLDTTLSSQDFVLNDAVSLYPNPVKGNNLNIRVANYITAKVSLYSVTGKQVLKSYMSNKDFTRINVSGLNKGIYMLKVETDKASVTRKVIIM